MYSGYYVAITALRLLRGKHLKAFVSQEMGFHANSKQGDTLARMTADLNTVQDFLKELYGKFQARPFEIIGLMVGLFIIEWRLSIVVVLIFIPIIAVLGAMFKRNRKRAKDARGALIDTFVTFEQIAAGFRVIKSLGTQQKEVDRFGERNNQWRRKELKSARSRTSTTAFSNGAAFLIFNYSPWLVFGW